VHSAADDAAVLELVLLVAMHRIDEIVREIVEKMELVEDVERIRGETARAGIVVILCGDASPRGIAAVARIERAEPAGDETFVDRTHGNVCRAGPDLMIDHARERVAFGVVPLAVAKHGAQLACVVGIDEGPVVMLELAGLEQLAIAQRLGAGGEQARKTIHADRTAQLIGYGVAIADVDRSHRAEIADGGIIGTFRVGDTIGQLRNHEVQIGVALTVRMRRLVDRHAVDRGGEVGAVVQIVSAHDELVGLALAAVERDDQAGYGLEELSRTICRRELQFLVVDDAFAGGRSRADEFPALCGDGHDLDGACIGGERLRTGGGDRQTEYSYSKSAPAAAAHHCFITGSPLTNDCKLAAPDDHINKFSGECSGAH